MENQARPKYHQNLVYFLIHPPSYSQQPPSLETDVSSGSYLTLFYLYLFTPLTLLSPFPSITGKKCVNLFSCSRIISTTTSSFDAISSRTSFL